MLLVEAVLNPPAALRLVHGRPHGGGNGVGVENNQPLRVPGRPADGLNQGGLGPEEALLVRVQHGHEADLGKVQALPQEIDAN